LKLEPVENRPTAKQLVVVGHATPLKTVEMEPAAVGVVVFDHTAAAPAGWTATNVPKTRPKVAASVLNRRKRDRRVDIGQIACSW
jgi:hypothetical protein